MLDTNDSGYIWDYTIEANNGECVQYQGWEVPVTAALKNDTTVLFSSKCGDPLTFAIASSVNFATKTYNWVYQINTTGDSVSLGSCESLYNSNSDEFYLAIAVNDSTGESVSW